MLYLESYVHRVQLAEIVSRWVVNKPRQGDVRTLKEIVNFNSYIARIWADEFSTKLFRDVYGQEPKSFLCKTKGDVKDFIVRSLPRYTNERVDHLFNHYRTYPEDYYRDTPYDGRTYYIDGPENRPIYVGSSRIKRFRRIAEKGSRRIVDYLFERIRASADALAEERASRLGIPKHQLITPKEEQVAEFTHAERRLLKVIRQSSIQTEFPILSIPDAVGIKVLTEGDQYETLVESLQKTDRCSLLEVEQHTGRYNAINLRVAYRIPRDLLAAYPPSGNALKVFAYRGLNPETLHERYAEFLRTAEDQVLLEVIVSNYQESLESEIGRSMHEDRIFEQRSNLEYNAHLATNVLYLMDYILAFCLSPRCQEIDDVPIKLWVKYMPDTMDRLFRQLFRVPVDASFDGDPADDALALNTPPAVLRSLVK